MGEAHKQNLICKITNGACLVDNCITHNANSNKKNFLNVNQTFVPLKKKTKKKQPLPTYFSLLSFA